MRTPPAILAARADSLPSETLPWLLVLLGMLVFGAVVVFVVRRWLRQAGDDDALVGFTLHDLRAMHGAGQLTDEEFAKARDALIERVRSGVDGPRGGDEGRGASEAEGR